MTQSITRRAASLVILGAALLMGACASHATAETSSPQEFLAELYGHYEGKGAGAGLDYSKSDVLQRYFTPAMVAAIEADFDQAAAADEPPALNGDPFVGSQEWNVTRVDIAITKSTTPDATQAIVSIENMGSTSEVKLDLAQVEGTWKIADIDWGYDRLSAILVP
ncbi:uncharacterized protein DUF3828 [Dongia mobilis]|uniref:Uncharacterized protein DUF3828 n=1 Tax=Dongia mobilis TaxID=578943 RepID=A0A4R6WUV0_9PROT|nr:DUF3828 domain-containing protein [Dongia mobilis]TDQ83066.1 uncharacterized protein DUF3828 [Dongia mobilis]